MRRWWFVGRGGAYPAVGGPQAPAAAAGLHSEVYGKLDKPKFSKDDDVILVRWCYAASKMIDEFLAHAYYKEKGRLPTVVARLFNTIGPRQTGQYGMVVRRFVRLALGGDPLSVYGDAPSAARSPGCGTWWARCWP